MIEKVTELCETQVAGMSTECPKNFVSKQLQRETPLLKYVALIIAVHILIF